VEPTPLILKPFIFLFYQTWKTYGDDSGEISGINVWQGNPNSVNDKSHITRGGIEQGQPRREAGDKIYTKRGKLLSTSTDRGPKYCPQNSEYSKEFLDNYD
jgi:hypothetical protein